MSKTSIEWVRNADGTQGFTVNPIRLRNLATGKIGHHCTKISPGCANCYASEQQSPYLSGLTYTAENSAKGEFFLEEKVLEEVLRRKKPATYFWCDMTDMFGGWVPDERIDRIAATCALTPQHRHIWLTKRAKRMREWVQSTKGTEDCPSCAERGFRLPLPNVALGVSVEDRAHLDRLDDLRQTWAALRFISAEPLLGHLGKINLDGIGWVIVGGESGPNARPMNPDWARSVKDQCEAAGVNFFFKQWGHWLPVDDGGFHNLADQVRTFGDQDYLPVGKRAAGRLLDGREWDELPEWLGAAQ